MPGALSAGTPRIQRIGQNAAGGGTTSKARSRADAKSAHFHVAARLEAQENERVMTTSAPVRAAAAGATAAVAVTSAAKIENDAQAVKGVFSSLKFGGAKNGGAPPFSLHIDCSRIAVKMTAEVVADWGTLADGELHQVEFLANKLDMSFENLRMEVEPKGSLMTVWNMDPVEPGSVFELSKFFWERRDGWSTADAMPWGGIFKNSDVTLTFFPQPISEKQLQHGKIEFSV